MSLTPLKTIPSFLKTREELYGNDELQLSAVLPEQASLTEKQSAYLQNCLEFRNVKDIFDHIFLPFSEGANIHGNVYQKALSNIWIGDRQPFSENRVTENAVAVIAVVNHLAKRYVEAERSGDTVSFSANQEIITFCEPVFPPVERPFWQTFQSRVRQEQAQYQALLKRNQEAEILCSQLTLELHTSKFTEQYQSTFKNDLSQAMSLLAACALEASAAENNLTAPNLADPTKIASIYPSLKDTPLGERLRPQLEYYAHPENASSQQLNDA